jgi:hypothetical protein
MNTMNASPIRANSCNSRINSLSSGGKTETHMIVVKQTKQPEPPVAAPPPPLENL